MAAFLRKSPEYAGKALVLLVALCGAVLSVGVLFMRGAYSPAGLYWAKIIYLMPLFFSVAAGLVASFRPGKKLRFLNVLMWLLACPVAAVLMASFCRGIIWSHASNFVAGRMPAVFTSPWYKSAVFDGFIPHRNSCETMSCGYYFTRPFFIIDWTERFGFQAVSLCLCFLLTGLSAFSFFKLWRKSGPKDELRARRHVGIFTACLLLLACLFPVLTMMSARAKVAVLEERAVTGDKIAQTFLVRIYSHRLVDGREIGDSVATDKLWAFPVDYERAYYWQLAICAPNMSKMQGVCSIESLHRLESKVSKG